MNCLLNLFNRDNPYGCCNAQSDLFQCWFLPLVIITSPIWLPLGTICFVTYKIGEFIYDSVINNYNWSQYKSI